MYIPGSSKGRKKNFVCKISALMADFLRRSWKWSCFLPTVVNFVFRTFWADLALLCVKM